jgi:hypothetical protein
MSSGAFDLLVSYLGVHEVQQPLRYDSEHMP